MIFFFHEDPDYLLKGLVMFWQMRILNDWAHDLGMHYGHNWEGKWKIF